MCKTTEKHKSYRKRRLNNGERRINIWLPLDTITGMKKYTELLGISNRELIIRVVCYMDEICNTHPEVAT